MQVENKSYDEIYNMFAPFKNKDGSLTHEYIRAYLLCNNFKYFETTDYNLIGILKEYNTRETQVIIEITDNHLIYLDNETIYDIVDITQREKWLELEVTKLYLRTKGE